MKKLTYEDYNFIYDIICDSDIRKKDREDLKIKIKNTTKGIKRTNSNLI